jgi:catechol 2,3-dioxygenase-like lactoylglutathione lyase family enzyme
MDTAVPAIAGFHHVKLPVSDVQRSREWYERVLAMVVHLEFVEDGRLAGVALKDPADTVQIALRQEPARSDALSGFDPVALRVSSTDDLERWRRRLDELGESHGGIHTGHVGQVLIGLRDPDGVEIRLYVDTAQQG